MAFSNFFSYPGHRLQQEIPGMDNVLPKSTTETKEADS